jgi:tyrosyl-tRNA synthetase
LESLQGADINEAKKALADAATAMAHGEQAAIVAAETARRTFEEGRAGDQLPTHSAKDAISLVDAMLALGLVASKGEARRLIAGGGARIDGVAAANDAVMIEPSNVPIRISAGKKKHGILQFG